MESWIWPSPWSSSKKDFFLMLIWENILDSVSRTIFNKAFKPSVLPDLCRNAVNLSYITWSGLQPSGKIWDRCCVPCWANSTLLQLWVPNPWGWNRMGLWQCMTAALCLLGLPLGCGKCHVKGTLKKTKVYSLLCVPQEKHSTGQSLAWWEVQPGFGEGGPGSCLWLLGYLFAPKSSLCCPS